MALPDLLVAALVLIGATFALLGSIGLARFPDLLTRLHGPSKATTLGIGSLLLASMASAAAAGTISVHELAITLFLVITTPVGAQSIARAAMQRVAAANPVKDP